MISLLKVASKEHAEVLSSILHHEKGVMFLNNLHEISIIQAWVLLALSSLLMHQQYSVLIFDKNVPRGLREFNPVYSLGAVVQYSLIQYLWWLYRT